MALVTGDAAPGKVHISSTPSNTILPPLVEPVVGVAENVPSLPPTKSLHVPPLPGYDLLFPAST